MEIQRSIHGLKTRTYCLVGRSSSPKKDVAIQPGGPAPPAVIPVSGQAKSVFVESGKLFANFKKESKERYQAEWWAFDRAGGDCLKGIYPTAAEEEKAWEQLGKQC